MRSLLCSVPLPQLSLFNLGPFAQHPLRNQHYPCARLPRLEPYLSLLLEHSVPNRGTQLTRGRAFGTLCVAGYLHAHHDENLRHVRSVQRQLAEFSSDSSFQRTLRRGEAPGSGFVTERQFPTYCFKGRNPRGQQPGKNIFTDANNSWVACSLGGARGRGLAMAASLDLSRGEDEEEEEEAWADTDTWAPSLMQHEVTIRGRTFIIIQPRSEDEVIDMYIKQDRLDRDPYWSRLWPSAIALAEEILDNPALVAGRRVCDLGCGLGLPGIAAAMAGAKEVAFYDREPLALQCALLSAHANIPSLVSNLPVFLPLHSSPPPKAQNNSPTPPSLPSLSLPSVSPPTAQTPLLEASLSLPDSSRCRSVKSKSVAQPSPSSVSDSPARPPSISPLLQDLPLANLSHLAQSLPWLPALQQRRSTLSTMVAGAGKAGGSFLGEPSFQLRELESSKEGGAEMTACLRSVNGGEELQPCAHAKVFDWCGGNEGGPRFDVVLACDVLYESSAVDLIAGLIPRLLHPQSRKGKGKATVKGKGGRGLVSTERLKCRRLLVSDPLERAPNNRARFIDLMQRKGREGQGLEMTSIERRQPTHDGRVHQIESMLFEGTA
eukprot:TRINITY_DN22176_c0_g1_i1.p1 TRINITY_DN22176_c0_g1~~TRINITY_DN22176_c0_g1_i1.p1  ORF type:complete len:604 (-),score=73.00 TRINITY_DN22176_c0_g1_i1:253-2064(-)